MPLGKLAIGNILSNLCIFKPTCLRKMPVGVPFYGALLEICVISTDMSVPKITQQYDTRISALCFAHEQCLPSF